jgi:GxxExxY protein
MAQNRGTEATEVAEAVDRALTHEIIGCAIEVHRVLGPGLLESVYEAALFHEASLRGIQSERQVMVPVVYKGLKLNAGIRLDLRIAGRVVVEVKSVERLHQIHRAQLLTYLKLTGLRTGLLFNFNVEFLRNGMRRVVNG